MPDFSLNAVTYEIAIFNGQVEGLTDAAGEPVFVFYSRVRVKPPAENAADTAGWVLVTDGNQAAISRTNAGALEQAQEYIQNNPA